MGERSHVQQGQGAENEWEDWLRGKADSEQVKGRGRRIGMGHGKNLFPLYHSIAVLSGKNSISMGSGVPVRNGIYRVLTFQPSLDDHLKVS